MKDESLVGVTDLVAGEKDPRNLMLIFSMLRVMMLEWDIREHAQTMFDSVYAYFPITFRPPPNDPYGITAQDLKDRLRECLSSTGVLAQYTFPSMLDRLDSTSTTVKKDCLQTLASCASTYDPEMLTSYSIPLWDAVKFEVLQAQEPELAEEALLVLRNIAACLTTSPKSLQNAANSPLYQYLKPINKECLEHLQEPAARQAKASGDILKAVSSASLPAFEIVIKAIGPALFTIHQSSQGLVQQRAILEITNQMFEASIEVYGSWSIPSQKNPESRPNLIAEFKDKFVALYSQALMGTVKEEVSFRLTALNGLLLISKMASMLSDDEIGLFVQYFDDIVLKEESYGRDELKGRAMTALAELSQFKPNLVSNITFPAFMARLPNSEDDARSVDYSSVLEGLAEISIEKHLLEILMRRLFNKLDLLFKSSISPTFPYTSTILGTILYVLNRSVAKQKTLVDAYFDRVVVTLSRKTSESMSGPLTNEMVLDLLGRIMNLIVRQSSTEAIEKTAENTYALFGQASADASGGRLAKLREQPTRTILSTWLLAAIPRTTQSPSLLKDQVPQNINDLLDFAVAQSDPAVTQSCLSQVALYVNKHVQTPDLGFVDDLLSQNLSNLQHEPTDENRTPEFEIRLIFALYKALILRVSPKINEYLVELVGLLDSTQYPPQVCQKAAMGFTTILAPDDILSKQNGAQIRLLAPQRVFQTLTPLISDRFKTSHSSDEKENYLIALSGILASVPSEIVMPELPTLLPLLLQSLDIADQMVKIATLETIAVVISSNPAALVESGHIPALVKRLITVATVEKTTASKVAPKARSGKTPTPSTQGNLPRARRLAARCITLMPKYISASGAGVNPLLVLKQEVLRGLMHILDDGKRDVRKEAVDARAAWIRGVDDVNDGDD